MSDDVLILEKTGAIATLTLNRPNKMNAFDDALRTAMRRTVARIKDDREIRVVILRGAGRCFSAGADLSAGPVDPASFHLDIDYKPFLTAIAQSDKIWIAQVHNACAGIGAALAMICDFMVMAEDAYIYMAFAAIALVPDGGNTRLLLDAMGYRRALQACIEGRKIPAVECESYGIANKVVPLADIDTETRAWGRKARHRRPARHGSHQAPDAVRRCHELRRRHLGRGPRTGHPAPLRRFPRGRTRLLRQGKTRLQGRLTHRCMPAAPGG